MATQASTNLEQQIRSQPDELLHLLPSETVREQVHAAAEGLQRSRADLGRRDRHQPARGASSAPRMLQDAGRSAVAVSSMQFVVWAPIVGPDDGVVVITHTGETAYALAARALASTAGLDVDHDLEARARRSRTRSRPCAKETSETYTVSYTTALLALAMIATEMGADSHHGRRPSRSCPARSATRSKRPAPSRSAFRSGPS